VVPLDLDVGRGDLGAVGLAGDRRSGREPRFGDRPGGAGDLDGGGEELVRQDPILAAGR
jgi:hypothetical protein